MKEVNRNILVNAFGERYGNYLASLLYRKIGGVEKQILTTNGGNRYSSGVKTIRMIIHYDIDTCIREFKSLLDIGVRTSQQEKNYNKAIKRLAQIRENNL